MLYIATFTGISAWMALVLRKKQLSWHTVVAAYSFGVYSADITEVSFNLLMGLYKFPTRLLADPMFDNELGIVFSDTLILPFALIVFLYYVGKYRPWKVTLVFTSLFVLLELLFLGLGYLIYLHWSIVFSALFYLAAFSLAARKAPKLTGYHPPVSYPIRLMAFSHTFIMWACALFALPILRMYQFRPGVFTDAMADCCFTDLLSGDVMSILLVLLVTRVPRRWKAPACLLIACLGIAFSLVAYSGGWLLYRQWNHFFMALRYIAPVFLVFLYDRWESAYPSKISNF